MDWQVVRSGSLFQAWNAEGGLYVRCEHGRSSVGVLLTDADARSLTAALIAAGYGPEGGETSPLYRCHIDGRKERWNGGGWEPWEALPPLHHWLGADAP
jgi:hypothetical protein